MASKSFLRGFVRRSREPHGALAARRVRDPSTAPNYEKARIEPYGIESHLASPVEPIIRYSIRNTSLSAEKRVPVRAT